MNLLFKVEGRTLFEGFKRWCDNAAGLARARVLDTRAHARALVTMAEALEQAKTEAIMAASALGNATRLAAVGHFASARKEAELAREFADDAETSRRRAETVAAREAGPNDGERVREILSAAHGAAARASNAARDAAQAADPAPAADAFFRRSLVRRVFLAWRRYIDWLRPLRVKARRCESKRI